MVGREEGLMKRQLISLLILDILARSLCAKDIPVVDAIALRAVLASANPGDHLILSEGEWRDVDIIFTGQGTEAAPITLKAAVPGKTVLTGSSTLRLGGQYFVVEGLLFQDP